MALRSKSTKYGASKKPGVIKFLEGNQTPIWPMPYITTDALSKEVWIFCALWICMYTYFILIYECANTKITINEYENNEKEN